MSVAVAGSLLAAVLSAAPASAAIPGRAGDSCPRTGARLLASGVTYACQIWTGRNRWVVIATGRLPAFEIKYIKTVTRRVLDDTATVDCRMYDGIGVSTRMDMLGDDYDNLAHEAGLPPGAPASTYRARAATLGQFSHKAAYEVDSGDALDGYARYAVVRKEGKPLLAMINTSLGTGFHYTTKTC
jgi:hypothetical protein